jgi:hypothetical protein
MPKMMIIHWNCWYCTLFSDPKSSLQPEDREDFEVLETCRNLIGFPVVNIHLDHIGVPPNLESSPYHLLYTY